jgi:hypothetical protein
MHWWLAAILFNKHYGQMRTAIISIIGLFISTLTFGQANDSGNRLDNPTEYIKSETIGGKLDFNLILEKKESTPFYLYKGVAYNKKDYAIFLWGQAVKQLGISSAKKAAKLWVEINKKELTGPEKKALTRGFETELK